MNITQDLMHSLHAAVNDDSKAMTARGGQWLKKAINWSEQALKQKTGIDDQGTS